MRYEVRERHFAGEDERNRTRHEANEHEPAAERLDDSRRASKRRQVEWLRRFAQWIAEELLRTVGDEQERCHDSKDAEQVRRPRWRNR
jgi:hypothetical protein